MRPLSSSESGSGVPGVDWAFLRTRSPRQIDSLASSSFRSGCRPNVLVHPKEVLGIVLGLDLPETRIVGAIGGADCVLRLIVAEVVHIAGGGHEGLHLRVAVARPGH